MDTIKSFQYDDGFMDKIQLPDLTVQENTANLVLDMQKLKSSLSIGESIRTNKFSFIQTDPHAWLSQLIFELRIYPFGQHCSRSRLNVYLVLVKCPDDQPQPLPELEVSISFQAQGRKHALKAKKNKIFDWSKKCDRWLCLDVPADKISSSSVLFSMSIILVCSERETSKKKADAVPKEKKNVQIKQSSNKNQSNKKKNKNKRFK